MLFFCTLTNAMEPIDGYYSNDLLGAVDEAKERPHHYDYSNTYRYKRTTAQSIHLNQIDLNDLEDTHLSMTKTNKGNNNEHLIAEEISLDNDSLNPLNKSDQSILLPSASLPKNTATSISLMGELSSSGILNNSTLQSTPRP